MLALVVLDLGAVVQDVSSRTLLYARAPQVRTRLNAVYTVATFGGGGLSSAAVGSAGSSPVLFINGDFDQVCTIVGNRQGEPMRAACPDLTATSMPAGH